MCSRDLIAGEANGERLSEIELLAELHLHPQRRPRDDDQSHRQRSQSVARLSRRTTAPARQSRSVAHRDRRDAALRCAGAARQPHDDGRLRDRRRALDGRHVDQSVHRCGQSRSRAIRRSRQISTSRVRRTAISRLSPARTNASAWRSRGWKAASPSAAFSRATRISHALETPSAAGGRGFAVSSICRSRSATTDHSPALLASVSAGCSATASSSDPRSGRSGIAAKNSHAAPTQSAAARNTCEKA